MGEYVKRGRRAPSLLRSLMKELDASEPDETYEELLRENTSSTKPIDPYDTNYRSKERE